MLSAFQIACETALRAALAQHGSTLHDRSLCGESETYITARFAGTEMSVYIYDDEASILGPGVDRRFEAPDFDSPHELQTAFVLACLDVLARLRS